MLHLKLEKQLQRLLRGNTLNRRRPPRLTTPFGRRPRDIPPLQAQLYILNPKLAMCAMNVRAY